MHFYIITKYKILSFQEGTLEWTSRGVRGDGVTSEFIIEKNCGTLKCPWEKIVGSVF